MNVFVLDLVEAYPLAAVGVALVVLAVVVWAVARGVAAAQRGLAQTPGAVVVTAVAAAGCTAYSGDTSWRFAAHYLDMVNLAERVALFAAGELALLACALLARETIRQTTTPERAGTPGVPGVLVWLVTAVQVIPAYAEGGPVGGTVRAFFGPVLAALLWHLAMGLEIRAVRPGLRPGGFLAIAARELRERALSWLGLAVRERTAEQITRERWTRRAVALAARLATLPEGARRRRARVERRLSKAVARSGVGDDAEQRGRMLALLAARRHAAALATVELPEPWKPEPEPAEPQAELTRLDEVPPGPELELRVPLLGDFVPLLPLPPGFIRTTSGTGHDQAGSRRREATGPEPEPEPEPAEPPGGTSGTGGGSGAADIESADSENTRFRAHVDRARNWLEADPELSGTAIGARLGTSDSYGRRVRRAVLAGR